MSVLVSDWSLKALKGSVQENTKVLVLVLVQVNGGTVVIRVLTLMLPSKARLLIQVARAPVTVTEAPFGSGWLKSVNLSPGTRLFGPRLCTFIVPPATLLINEPETLTMSFDGESVLLISIVNVDALLVKWLLIVSVPTEEPGQRVPVSSV